MKICFGIISWFPNEEPFRTQRITRLNNTFKQLFDLFGNKIDFLIISQNWKDYKIPSYIKNAQIFEYRKLGILGARKTLREKFLESKYDYLIMCDDDIILKTKDNDSVNKFLNDLEKHPYGFGFIRYGWSLTFCAISKWIYQQQPMVDVDPEKGEGFEDTTFPNLLHYRFPEHEFKITEIDFLQHYSDYKKNHKSTWVITKNNKPEKLKFLTDCYVERFKKGLFEIDQQVKDEALRKWNNRKLTELEEYIDLYNYSK